MPTKIPDIKHIANIIKLRFNEQLYKMHFIFCYKMGQGKYFIFQEVQGMPIQRLIYGESNNSVTFVASWAAWGNPFALISDSTEDKMPVWKDLLDRSRPYNAYLTNGGFDATHWHSQDRQNKKEKKRNHKSKSDTFFEFRIDKIERACFYSWGFELFSPQLNLIALKRKDLFPYQVEEVDHNTTTNSESLSSVIQNNSLKVEWSGRSFNIAIPSGVQTHTYPDGALNSGEAVNIYEPDSYWDKNECDEANDLFDEEIAEILLADDEETKERILDVGQRNIDLIIE